MHRAELYRRGEVSAHAETQVAEIDSTPAQNSREIGFLSSGASSKTSSTNLYGCSDKSDEISIDSASDGTPTMHLCLPRQFLMKTLCDGTLTATGTHTE